MKKRWIVTLVIFIFLLTLAFLFGGEVIAVLSPPPTAAPTSTATSTLTATFTPSPTFTSTPTPTATSTPTVTPVPCFTLLEPADGAELERTIGKITFAWTEQYEAVGYRVAITIPSGYVEEKELAETSFERWLESLPMGGEYTWQVIAFDDESAKICQAGPWGFSKAKYVPKINNSGNGQGCVPETSPGNGNPGNLIFPGVCDCVPGQPIVCYDTCGNPHELPMLCPTTGGD